MLLLALDVQRKMLKNEKKINKLIEWHRKSDLNSSEFLLNYLLGDPVPFYFNGATPFVDICIDLNSKSWQYLLYTFSE